MTTYSDSARRQLRRLVELHHDVWEEPARLRALLTDLCPRERREVSILVVAAEEGVPAALREAYAAHASVEVARRLQHHLTDARSMHVDAAHWAVDAWAEALEIDLDLRRTPIGTEIAPFARASTANVESALGKVLLGVVAAGCYVLLRSLVGQTESGVQHPNVARVLAVVGALLVLSIATIAARAMRPPHDGATS